jgi:hypothetical protein
LGFVDNFLPPLKGGFVGSLIVLKPHLAPYTVADLDEDQQAKRARGEPVQREILEGPAIRIGYPDPYNLWLDWTGRNLFVIEEEEMDLSMAFDLADMGVLDGDAVRAVRGEDHGDFDRETREAARRQQTPAGRPSFRKVVKLTHFWGSLSKGDGTWALRNGHFVVLNDKYVGRKPQENPYSHGQLPYIIGSPFRRPFSVYHKGLIEDVVGLAKAMTELLNLSLDSTLFSGIKAFEVDLDQIDDPQQLLSGIYPGKVFTKRAGGAGAPMIRDIEMSGVNRETLGLYQVLKTEYQNSTAVTEFITGALAGSGGARTATEIVTKQHQGMGIFGEIGRNLEGTVLEPMLEQLAALILDYHDDFSSEEIIEVLGEEEAMRLFLMGPIDRRSRIPLNKMRVRASGVTALLSRTEELQKIMTLMQSLGQFGPALSMIFQDIDVPFFFKNLFRRMIRAYGWDEEEFIRPAAAPAPPATAPGGGVPPQPGGGGGGGVPPQPGQPAPPPLVQTARQIEQIRSQLAGGGLPPSGAGGVQP